MLLWHCAAHVGVYGIQCRCAGESAGCFGERGGGVSFVVGALFAGCVKGKGRGGEGKMADGLYGL